MNDIFHLINGRRAALQRERAALQSTRRRASGKGEGDLLTGAGCGKTAETNGVGVLDQCGRLGRGQGRE